MQQVEKAKIGASTLANKPSAHRVIFYLGTHEAHWLNHSEVPLMVSRNRLVRLGKLPVAKTEWVMDSGGFTELQQHGRWRVDAKTYADYVKNIQGKIGSLVWAAPQDWMCEPVVIHGGTMNGVTFAGTGLTVEEHQERTVANYLELKAMSANVIPVLQGFTLEDYERCADWYEQVGVDLATLPTVGLGSVCRRENTDEIGKIVISMKERGLRLHGFGCKGGAIRRYGEHLTSADSMAWSLSGRRQGACVHLKSRCANHQHYAMEWRERTLGV